MPWLLPEEQAADTALPADPLIAKGIELLRSSVVTRWIQGLPQASLVAGIAGLMFGGAMAVVQQIDKPQFDRLLYQTSPAQLGFAAFMLLLLVQLAATPARRDTAAGRIRCMNPMFRNAHLALGELLAATPASAPPAAPYLGPATVLAVSDRRVDLALPDGRCTAQIAISQSYAPVVGDTVLAVCRAEEWFVIGLIQGTGTTTFTAPGDLELQAPRGRIELLARDGVFLTSDLVEIVATRIELTARHVIERFHSLTQWIGESLHRRLGRMHTTVEGDYELRAGRITEIADEDVAIDGKTIHLG